MKRLFTMIVALAVIGLVSGAFAQVIYDIPLDAQINIGRSTGQSPTGDAIYDPFGAPPDTMLFMADEPPDGYTRHLIDGGGAGSWAYMYFDFYLAGETNDWIDITGAIELSFDTRFFNDPMTNTNPYGDAPVFVRLYTYDIDPATGEYDLYQGHRDFGIVYATQAPWSDPPFPTWTHVVIDPNDATTYTEGGVFDKTKVSRMRFYNTDWSGTGDDFVDYKNLIIAVPEPSTIAMFGVGLMSLLALRRRK